MEAVMTARHNEPCRKEFVHARELRERGRKEGYEEGKTDGIEQGRAEERAVVQAELEKERAIAQTEIAALKAEIERLKRATQ